MYAADANEPTQTAFRCAVATAIARERDEHFSNCGCRCHLLPAPAPRLRQLRLCLERVTVTNRCDFLLDPKAALKPSKPPLTLAQHLTTRMVPGPHYAPSSRRDAAFQVGVRYHAEEPKTLPGLSVAK